MRSSLLCPMSTICIVLGMAVILALELEELDKKIVFPHANLDEEIYII